MASTVSSFFSKDKLLSRQSRTARTRKQALAALAVAKQSPSAVISKPLQIIVEEGELSNRAASRSTSPMQLGAANDGVGPSETNASVHPAARRTSIHEDLSIPDFIDSLFSSPRPAPRPLPIVTAHIPDSSVNVAYKFPSSRSPSMSPNSSARLSPPPSMTHSPSSSISELEVPLRTPRTSGEHDRSDAEILPLPTPKFCPYRVSIKPLRIVKNKKFPVQSRNDTLTTSFICTTSPTRSCESPSESESDVEWYSREFAKIVTLRSPQPNMSCTSPVRPDSLPPTPFNNVFYHHPSSPTRPSPRISPPPASVLPSVQLDPDFPRRRSLTKTRPSQPPPPVPSVPVQFWPPRALSTVPRSNVPADCLAVGSLGSHVLQNVDEQRSISSWSFTSDDLVGNDQSPPLSPINTEFSIGGIPRGSEIGYEDYLHKRTTSADSGLDVNFPVELDLMDSEVPMMLPLSLPGSPIDFETDILHSLDELTAASRLSVMSPITIVTPGTDFSPPLVQRVRRQSNLLHPGYQAKSQSSLLFRRTTRRGSRAPPPLPLHLPQAMPTPAQEQHLMENKQDGHSELRSQWSSSTLSSSAAEERSCRGSKRISSRSRLRSYFGARSLTSPPANATPNATSISVHDPSSPESKYSLFSIKLSPSKKAGVMPMVDLPTSPTSPLLFAFASSSAVCGPARKNRAGVRHGRRESEVWEYGGAVRRRRGSLASSFVSDDGSEESVESDGPEGFKRKPIPIEMFLRSPTILTAA